MNLEPQRISDSDEVIDRNILIGLAILARANGHSVIEEINIGLSAYVAEHLPRVLDGDGTASGHAYSRPEHGDKCTTCFEVFSEWLTVIGQRHSLYKRYALIG